MVGFGPTFPTAFGWPLGEDINLGMNSLPNVIVNNPALTDESRNKSKLEAQEKLKEIQKKESELQQYQANTERSLQQRQRTHRDLMLDEIKKVVLIVAEKKGATLVLDTAGTSLLGIPNVLYSNQGWDITDDVLGKINENAPSE